MSAADDAIVLIPIALRGLTEIFRLIQKLRAQAGLSVDELWARADAQTQANRTEIANFLKEFAP